MKPNAFLRNMFINKLKIKIEISKEKNVLPKRFPSFNWKEKKIFLLFKGVDLQGQRFYGFFEKHNRSCVCVFRFSSLIAIACFGNIFLFTFRQHIKCSKSFFFLSLQSIFQRKIKCSLKMEIFCILWYGRKRKGLGGP